MDKGSQLKATESDKRESRGKAYTHWHRGEVCTHWVRNGLSVQGDNSTDIN